MGQGFSHVVSPNAIVLYQQGLGQNCDCGPAHFDAEHAVADSRLAQAGLSQEEIRRKIDALNAVLRRKLWNPLKAILCPIRRIQRVTGQPLLLYTLGAWGDVLVLGAWYWLHCIHTG